jgi:MFS family permease
MKEYLRQIGAFSRDARLLIIASVVLALGTAAPAIFATLYFRAIGFNAEMIGQVTSANQIGGALGTIPAMFFLARFGRRVSILAGAGLSLITWGAAEPDPVGAWH